MNLISTYKVKIKHYNKIFADTVKIYRDAVDFFIDVALKTWNMFSDMKHSDEAVAIMEALTHKTNLHPKVPYDFDILFYKFPCYLRRATIMDAVGLVASYKSNLALWEKNGRQGREPGIPHAGYAFPVMYKDNMYEEGGNPYNARIKIYRNNDWVWLPVEFRKSDADYIMHHCSNMRKKSPTLLKKGKQWYLAFPFEESISLNKTKLMDQVILSVDLGLNNACTCSVMTVDGAVHGRDFYKLPAETDRLDTSTNRIKKAQQHRHYRIPNKWAVVDGISDNIARKTADHIIDIAVLYSVDMIVFEHLDLDGKKHGSMKQRLHLWRAKEIQGIVEHKAHRNGIRVNRVNAMNTSKLAFDGSGDVSRGTYMQDGEEKHNCSVCVFRTGKTYNCDLNASYNIGARYFIRELLKSVPETGRLALEAKVPSLARRSTCTLSTLISLDAELMEPAA